MIRRSTVALAALVALAAFVPSPPPRTATADGFLPPAVAVPRSTQILYASAITGHHYTQATATTAPADDVALVNAAIASASAVGPVKLEVDTWLSAGVPLTLPSYTEVHFIGSGIYCRTGLNAPAIRNANLTSSYIGGTDVGDGSRTGGTTDFVGGHVVDTNISITGSGTIVGNRGNGTTGCCTSGDPRYSVGANGWIAGQWVQPVVFCGVNGLVVEGLTIKDPPSFGMLLANVFHVSMRGISSLDPVTAAGGTPGFGRNTDGPHITGPANDVVIVDMTVSAADDAFPCNASDGNLVTPNSTSTGIGPVIYGGWATVYKGPITNVSVGTLNLVNCLNAVRLLPGDQAIGPVSIGNVFGNTYQNSVYATPFSSLPTSGLVNQFFVRNWVATGPSGVEFAFAGTTTKNVQISVNRVPSGAAVQSITGTVTSGQYSF